MIDLSAFDRLADTLKIDDNANYQWRIARRPEGNVQPEDFEWAVSEIPEPGEGEVLLKTHYLGLAPLMRMYMAGLDPSGEGVRPIGGLIPGRGVSQVIESRHPDRHEGEMVQGQMGENDPDAEQRPAGCSRRGCFGDDGPECPCRIFCLRRSKAW